MVRVTGFELPGYKQTSLFLCIFCPDCLISGIYLSYNSTYFKQSFPSKGQNKGKHYTLVITIEKTTKWGFSLLASKNPYFTYLK